MKSVLARPWTSGLFVVVALVAVFTLGVSRTGAQRGEGPAAPTAADLEVLKGAIDFHPHLDPDEAGGSRDQDGRGLDMIDMAREAQKLGMRGFVAKEHFGESAEAAYLTRKAVPGVEVFGGIVLNFTQGGINPRNVEHMAMVKGGYGRVVWMPTRDAEPQVMLGKDKNLPFIPVSKGGDLLPAVKDVIAYMAKTKTRDSQGDLILATGHLSAEDMLAVVREGQRQGVRKMLLTHPMRQYARMTIPQLQEAVKMGAVVEILAELEEKVVAQNVQAIRAIGAEHFIFASDWGQGNRPFHPPQGLALAAKALRAQGITPREIDVMFKENPARMLGLSTAGSASAGARP